MCEAIRRDSPVTAGLYRHSGLTRSRPESALSLPGVGIFSKLGSDRNAALPGFGIDCDPVPGSVLNSAVPVFSGVPLSIAAQLQRPMPFRCLAEKRFALTSFRLHGIMMPAGFSTGFHVLRFRFAGRQRRAYAHVRTVGKERGESGKRSVFVPAGLSGGGCRTVRLRVLRSGRL